MLSVILIIKREFRIEIWLQSVLLLNNGLFIFVLPMFFAFCSPLSFFYKYISFNFEDKDSGRISLCHLNFQRNEKQQESFEVYMYITTIWFLILAPSLMVTYVLRYIRITSPKYAEKYTITSYIYEQEYTSNLNGDQRTNYVFVWTNVISFFMFLAPQKALFFHHFWNSTETDTSASKIFSDYAFQVILYIYCALNPLIYYVLLCGFKKDLRRLKEILKRNKEKITSVEHTFFFDNSLRTTEL